MFNVLLEGVGVGIPDVLVEGAVGVGIPDVLVEGVVGVGIPDVLVESVVGVGISDVLVEGVVVLLTVIENSWLLVVLTTLDGKELGPEDEVLD